MSKVIILQPVYDMQFRVSRGQSLSRQLREQGRDPPWKGRPSITQHARIHPHTHSDWDNLDTWIHPPCTWLGCGRKPEYTEKTHADWDNVRTLHRQRPHYNKWCRTKQSVFEALSQWRILFMGWLNRENSYNITLTISLTPNNHTLLPNNLWFC